MSAEAARRSLSRAGVRWAAHVSARSRWMGRWQDKSRTVRASISGRKHKEINGPIHRARRARAVRFRPSLCAASRIRTVWAGSAP